MEISKINYKIFDQKTILVDSSVNLDAHLFLLLIPALFIVSLLIFRKRIIKINNGIKSKLIIFSGLLFILLFGFSIYEYGLVVSWGKDENANLEIITIFYNVDSLLLLVIGLAMITKKLTVIRTLTPFALVIGIANLINNPGAHITYTAATSNAILCTLPLLSTILVNKTIAFREFAFSVLMSISLLIFIAVVNAISSEEFSMINAKILSSNKVYKYIPTGTLKIVVFIAFTVSAQTVAWFILKSNMASKNIYQTFLMIKNEVRSDRNKIVTTKENIRFFELFSEHELLDFEIHNQDEDEQVETQLFFDDKKPNKWLEVKSASNSNVVDSPEIHGIRSPSC